MKKTFCFNLDNTICNSKGNKYALSLPKKKLINIINQLYNKSHYIQIYTARFMCRTKNKAFLAKKISEKLNKEQLKKWNFKYLKLIMGKPSFDKLIHDKSIFYKKNWPKYIQEKFKVN